MRKAANKAGLLALAGASSFLLQGCRKSDCPYGYLGSRNTVVTAPCTDQNCRTDTMCSQFGGAQIGNTCLLQTEHTVISKQDKTDLTSACKTIGGVSIGTGNTGEICVVPDVWSTLVDVLKLLN